VQRARDVAGRNSQGLRDVALAQVAEVPQRDHLALTAGKAAQPRPRLRPQDQAAQRGRPARTGWHGFGATRVGAWRARRCARRSTPSRPATPSARLDPNARTPARTPRRPHPRWSRDRRSAGRSTQTRVGSARRTTPRTRRHPGADPSREEEVRRGRFSWVGRPDVSSRARGRRLRRCCRRGRGRIRRSSCRGIRARRAARAELGCPARPRAATNASTASRDDAVNAMCDWRFGIMSVRGAIQKFGKSTP